MHQGYVRERVECMIEINAARPDLSIMDSAYAFAKTLQPLFLRKNAACPGAKTLENLLRLGRIEQGHAFDLRPERTHLAQHYGAVTGRVVQIVTEHYDINRHARNGRQQFLRIRGFRHNLESPIIAKGLR